MIGYKKTWQEQSWFWLLLLLLIAGLFLYIGNGVINAILQGYDASQNRPATNEDLFFQQTNSQNFYLFCASFHRRQI